MLKTVCKVLVTCLMLSSVSLVAGCGSGGGTGGPSGTTITLGGLSSTTIEAGTNVSGTLTIGASSSALNEVQVDIKTDNSAVTGSAGKTDTGGKAAFILTASPTANLSATVNVWAEYNGLKSNVLQISLKSYTESSTFTFAMGTPDPYTRTVDTGTAATTRGTVVAGNQVTFKAATGAVVTVPVEISVDSITGYANGDVVSVTGSNGVTDFTGTNPVGSVRFMINTVDGTVSIPVIYTYIVPAASSIAGITTSHTYSVVWRAKVTYNGMVYNKTAEVLVTASTTSQAPAAVP
jgi:hypothetical protein